nr:putative ribonuclease H-like domain-containing protein [Tanacetum cinerariifolium]
VESKKLVAVTPLNKNRKVRFQEPPQSIRVKSSISASGSQPLGVKSSISASGSQPLGKSKKHTHKPKSEDSIQEKLYLLHMDLYDPIRIESINGKKYILVIVDDCSRFT